ncbi:MAG: glutaredoxin family protein, partial [Actinomycetes bacterium]
MDAEPPPVTASGLSGRVRVTLITRPGCHLCDQAREVVLRVARQTATGVEERSILDDPLLARQYADMVPVVGGVGP